MAKDNKDDRLKRYVGMVIRASIIVLCGMSGSATTVAFGNNQALGFAVLTGLLAIVLALYDSRG
jgi:hypothetical protein